MENKTREEIERNLLIFLDAVELTGNLEIIGTAFPEQNVAAKVSPPKEGAYSPKRGPTRAAPAEDFSLPQKEVFVIRDHSKPEGIEGAFIEVSIDEIVRKITDYDKAQEFIRVLQNDRAPVVLQGITRIVGYYSRVNNWNKSKIGELRDRANGRYGLTNEKPVIQEERLKMINSL